MSARQAEENRERSALLAHMRHELRTPLNAIIGYSEMLLEDARDLDEDVLVPDLTAIREAGNTLLGIVNDILDPARLESAHEPVPAFGLKVRERIAEPLSRVTIHADRLLTLDHAAAGDAVRQEVGKIRSAAGKLSEILDQLGEMTPAAGAAAERPEISELIRDALETVKPLKGLGARVSYADQGGRVLVVDDNEMNRELLAGRLERDGYEVALAENGRRALEMIAAQPYDLVLLDMMMPEVNGYQVLQHLKSHPELRHIPVIMLSALDEVDSVVRCIELGAEDYLAKPFNPVLLRARIGASLEKKKLRDREVLYLQQIEEEKRRADELLHVILPAEIVEELKTTNSVKPRLYENVAVLFCDIVGFTPYCEAQPPEEVISCLQKLVEVYEELTLRHDLQKIKTIGDSFMATAGLLKRVDNPVLNSVRCGLEMLAVREYLPPRWQVRIGVHVGPAIAGVVGCRQYLFDLWGDTVNTAARVESQGEPGYVNVSGTAWETIRGHCTGDSLGMVTLKGKGQMELFRVSGLARTT
jgi:CheY-like chemotaxis protein